MATDLSYIQFVCEQLHGVDDVRYKKMFGEYMVYVQDKPVLLVCDNTVFVKQLPQLEELMKDAETGLPYEGTKPHYVLDIENEQLTQEVVKLLTEITPLPKKRIKKS